MLKNNHIHQERKVLHKVKRQWVILSAVTLLGTVGITSINVNAASSIASDTKSTSSLANTTAGYSNAVATLSEAASNAMNRLSANIASINDYASIRTVLTNRSTAKTSAAVSSIVASAHSAAKTAQSAYDQVKVANVIASAANTPGGAIQDGARAASQASAAFTTLMDNLANTDRSVGNLSSAVTQIESSSSSNATKRSANASAMTVSGHNSSAATPTSDGDHSTKANHNVATTTTKSTEPHSNASLAESTGDASTSAKASSTSTQSSQSSTSAAQYNETKATGSAVTIAKKSIATAKRQVKLAKTAKAKASANEALKRAQKNLLIVQNNYNYKYYYYFDGPFDTVTTKKTLYVYNNTDLTKKYRLKKVPKGTTISIFKVITDDHSSVFQVTGGNYITGKKSFFTN